jgi:glutamyl-tRNA synthetase
MNELCIKEAHCQPKVEQMSVITRFPPSPTGMMHIGSARTALFNWLYARHHGGKMLFRIEDTDRARHSEEAVVSLINAMKWLELDWEGEIVSQFEQRGRHAEVARELLAKGKAYHCYCSPEELEAMREKAKAEGKATFYDRRWRDSKEAPPPGVAPVIRIKAPLDGETTVADQVQGNVTVNNIQLDDFIILRSDGTPTYLLAVVVDDHDMGVTHVIRGDDHLNNTFRQNIIYDAMGWKQPVYGHLPLILGPDGTKMSKRHGAASVEEYRDMGYLPEAMRNYLLRLGWGHGDDEIIPTDKAIALFDLDGVGRAPARFDFDKLESINAHYMKEGKAEEILERALPFYKTRHGLEIDETAQARILNHAAELKSRARTLIQFADESAFYAKSLPLAYDEKAKALFDTAGLETLRTLYEKLERLEVFDHANIENACKDIAAALHGGKLGKVAMPLRAALTGTTVSPSVFMAAEILGRVETCARIQAALDTGQ